jgi:mRNA-degrading endonuclease RelE of RelBE toxin-antitoxin system
MNKFVISHTAMQAIESFPADVRKKVVSTLEQIQAEPTRFGFAYYGVEGDPIYVVRLDDYRIFYRFVADESAVLVLSIYRADGAKIPRVPEPE